MTVVAVYGSLRQGMGNHRRLEGQTFLGTTRTVESYAMYSLGGFPKVALEGAKVCPVVVELYEVDEAGMRGLDSLEGYRGPGASNFYDRSAVQCEDGNLALIYHIEGNANPADLVADGDWVTYVNNRGRRY